MAQIPILDASVWVERQAGRIADPVDRLRFLRREMRQGTRLRTRPRQGTQPRPKHRWRQASLVVGLIAMVAIVPVPTGTAETFAKEERLVVPIPKALLADLAPRVWLVDKSGASELYSNGLRIDLTFTVANRPRSRFPIFSLAGGAEPVDEGRQPVGIVYHTTESNLAPFEEEENHRLQRIGRNLIEWVRQGRSYHYVIDRFGRVYRVVEESDAANHAGTSIWADSRGVYVNLNDSFLGVSFEGRTGAVDEVTPAQVAAGKVLTEMLRSRYGIATENCVTHAQVSVNPQNMRIGEHTDWAGKFPFAGVGLPDNYSIPVASMYVFGFDYDSVFLRATGTRWRGLDLAELRVARQSAAEGLETRQYRAVLQHRYKDIASALKEKSEEVMK
ncbi:MAG TPA: peptidoglycan recognition family protein [Bryobacteraceae bacterium]|nr:peptidoglycan recognition family protein [Bryobacteraceae bacterium]